MCGERRAMSTARGNTIQGFIRENIDAEAVTPSGLRDRVPMVAPPTYAPPSYASPTVRRTPSLPFGWGAVTVLLVGAAFLIVGVLLILYGFFGFITGTISAATSSSFSVSSFFQSFFGAIFLFVIGGILAGIGGWLIRLWWIFLLVGVVAGVGSANTAREREAARTSEVRVRCQNCGRLNPEFVRFCMSCGKPV